MSRIQGFFVFAFLQINSVFMTTSAVSLIISPPERKITAQIGEPLHITAEAMDCEDPSFTWSSLLDKTLSGAVSTNGSISILNMMVSIDSEGQYVCKVFCKNGRSEKTFIIISYSFPSDPVLEVSSLMVGVESTITCAVPYVYPAEMMTVQILKNEKMIVESDLYTIIEDKPINISVSYSWTPEEENEGCQILCVAQLEFPSGGIDPKTRDTRMILNLIYPPGNLNMVVHPSTKVKWMETISLSCTCDSRTPVKIWWVKQRGGETLKIASDGNSSLEINQAQMEDSGEYICYAENAAGKKSASVEITVQTLPDKPTITVIPDTSVTLGQTVTIACSVNSGPLANVTLWLVKENKTRHLMDNKDVFEIQSVQIQDGATYICQAENPFGKAEATKTLTVKFPPTNTQVIFTPSAEVREGEFVHVMCKSTGFPIPELILKKKTDVGLQELEMTDGEYWIESATAEQAGTYICESRNDIGIESTEVNLTVQVPPKNTQLIILPSSSVKEGESISIFCNSTALPQPEIILKKKGLELESHNEVIDIKSVKLEDAGTYICESRNVVGFEITETTLNVQDMKEVASENVTVVVTPSEDVTEGDTVTITCETYSISSSTILLQKVCAENSTIIQAQNGTFTLRNVTLNDSGNYTVILPNEAGKRTKVIEINVLERRESPKPNYTVPIVVLSMAVSAGVICLIIYRMKQGNLQGSYSLVEALRSKV
ncbi:vascular cell adhesion 1 [Pelobates cultripes]|uniref:Vascular cell adhesion 1 n=1 Tax=Pelobates cultripes TaxID=61616 RepID=A0AAD1WK49_PELCU|nr:vascular cell adhesion 1 [Pelobates cultripes]